jgi:hypothetical protein
MVLAGVLLADCGSVPADTDELPKQVLGPVQHSHSQPHLLCDVHTPNHHSLCDHVSGALRPPGWLSLRVAPVHEAELTCLSCWLCLVNL